MRNHNFFEFSKKKRKITATDLIWAQHPNQRKDGRNGDNQVELGLTWDEAQKYQRM